MSLLRAADVRRGYPARDARYLYDDIRRSLGAEEHGTFRLVRLENRIHRLDWVPEWKEGYAPDGIDGPSSIYNLLFAYALQSAAELEDAYGETGLAERNRMLADRICKAGSSFL